MQSRENNPGLGRAGRVKLQLETLEDRCCPTVTLTPHLDISVNTGQILAVSDNGQGDITVNLTGHKATTYYGVQTIDIEAAKGASEISYTLTNTLKQAEQLTLQLGTSSDPTTKQGNDIPVTLNFAKGIEFTSPSAKNIVGVTVDGGGNRDVDAVFGALKNVDLKVASQLGSGLDHFLTQFTSGLAGQTQASVKVQCGSLEDSVTVSAKGTIAAAASLSVSVNNSLKGMDRWGDTTSVTYQGQLLGHLSITEKGGPAWDTLVSDVDLAAGSKGWLSTQEIAGGKGGTLISMVENAGSLKSLTAGISGANTRSAVIHTSNVKVT